MPDQRREESTSRGVAKGVLVLLGLVAAVLALYLGAVVAAGDGVRAGVSVAGVPIGGMSRADAVAQLQSTLGKRATKAIKVRAGDHVMSIKTAEAGLTFDPEATVDQVSGRTWNPVELLGGLLGSRSVDPVTTVDEAALRTQVENLAVAVDSEPVEPQLVVAAGSPRVKKGSAGTVVDQDALAALVTDAFLQPRKTIAAPMKDVQPAVTAEAADAGVALATSAVSAPVIVSAGDITATIPAATIAKALSFTVQDGAFVPKLDGAVLHAAIAKDLGAAEVPGSDATFTIAKGKPVIVPSKVGAGISDEELASQVATVLGKQTPERAVAVSLGTRDPALTTEQAQALCVTEKMSSFTQHFPYAAYRVQNIGQAAKYINGTLLLPGETFSMNDTVKERTPENGYTKGFIIAPGGVFAEELGGGVSTAATAMWTGAFYAGLERVYTQAHSIYISRYKPGLEATVSWGNFDMKFKNNTPCGVFITTHMTPTSITVDFWGSKQYDAVKAESSAKRAVTPFSTVYDEAKTCLGQGGVNGFTVDVDRVFEKAGAEVGRETITTKYKPTPRIVCGKKKADAGGKKPKPSASATASPAADDQAPAPQAGASASAKPKPKPSS